MNWVTAALALPKRTWRSIAWVENILSYYVAVYFIVNLYLDVIVARRIRAHEVIYLKIKTQLMSE